MVLNTIHKMGIVFYKIPIFQNSTCMESSAMMCTRDNHVYLLTIVSTFFSYYRLVPALESPVNMEVVFYHLQVKQ